MCFAQLIWVLICYNCTSSPNGPTWYPFVNRMIMVSLQISIQFLQFVCSYMDSSAIRWVLIDCKTVQIISKLPWKLFLDCSPQRCAVQGDVGLPCVVAQLRKFHSGNFFSYLMLFHPGGDPREGHHPADQQCGHNLAGESWPVCIFKLFEKLINHAFSQ